MAVLAALLLLPLGIQALFRPWARSFTGAPTLTGGWYGEGTVPSGQKEVIYLTVSPFLWSNDEGACFRGCGFDGVAKVCTANKTIQPYEVQGDVDNRRATTFTVYLKKSEDRHYGLRLAKLAGAWPGGDTMRLTGTPEFDRSNTSTSETGIWIDDAGQRHKYDRADQLDLTMPVTFMLRRGSEKDFSAACRR